MKQSNEVKAIYYLIATFVGIIYIYFVSSLPNEWFRDRNYYVIYAAQADEIIKNYGFNLSFFVNEPLFLGLAKFFGDFVSVEAFPIFMCFLVTSIFVISLIKSSKTLIMFLLGMISLVLISYLQTAQVMVLRQGVATAIFLAAFLFLKDEKKKLIICGLMSFFHSVFFIVAAIYAMYVFWLKNKDTKVMLLIVAAVSAVLYISSTFLLNYFGFRQADLYASENYSSGGGAFVLSLFTFIYIYFFGNKSNKALYDWSLIGLVLFLVGYFIFFSAGRLFVTFYPFVLMLLVSKSRIQDVIFLAVINLIYGFLFYTGAYMILFDYNSIEYVDEQFLSHVKKLFDIF